MLNARKVAVRRLLLASAAAAALLSAPAAQGASFKVLHTFGDTGDGSSPYGVLTNVDGTLYGTTTGGGGSSCGFHFSGCGTVFKINPKTGAYKVVYAFQENSTDGSGPSAGMIDVGGTLYGTTAFGGTFGGGTIFSVDPKTGKEKVVHSFQGDADGAWPASDLINVDGTLYSTTSRGGGKGDCTAAGNNIGCGTVFSFDPATGTEKVVYAFQGDSDGAYPVAGLTKIGKALYGTTAWGGGNFHCTGGEGATVGCGTIFKISPSGAETVLYSFCSQASCMDGSEPDSLTNVQGTLFGTANEGGDDTSCEQGLGCGTAFSLNLNTGKEKRIYSFTSSNNNGFSPNGFINVNGTFWGTTYNGGGGCGTFCGGTVFTLHHGHEKVVHIFTGDDGTRPWVPPMHVGGKFYGTTTTGGTYNDGTLYELTP